MSEYSDEEVASFEIATALMAAGVFSAMERAADADEGVTLGEADVKVLLIVTSKMAEEAMNWRRGVPAPVRRNEGFLAPGGFAIDVPSVTAD